MRSKPKTHHMAYKPVKRFKRVIDAWISDLHPEHVDKHALVTKGRKVLHYIPPHKPCFGKIKEYCTAGYLSNLEFIMARMTNLIPKLGGLTIITSDHGERFNNGKIIGHRCNKDAPDLRTVPWFTVGERK